MAIDLKFSKPNRDVSWGFRIVGGVDFNEPLVVVKVNENSIAEDAGLQVGDLLVRINDTSTAGVTHAEAHDLLISAGNEFSLGIRRGDMPTHIFHDENYNFECSDEHDESNRTQAEHYTNIVKQVEKTVDRDILDEAVERINQLNISNSREENNNIDIFLSENLAGQEEIIYTNASNTESKRSITHGIKTDKKWSTFLMKPDKPVPQCKEKIQQEKLQAEGYKVVIKKQPSRRKRAQMQEKKVHFDQNMTEVEVAKVETVDYNEETNEEIIKIEYKRDREIDIDVNVTEEETIEDVEDFEGSDNEVDVEDTNEAEKPEPETMQFLPLSQIKVDSTLESSQTLEEQLIAVQKQLQALSQLPSAIQITLDAVSKQLANIVSTKQNSEERETTKKEEENTENYDEEVLTEEENPEDKSTSEVAEAEIIDEDKADSDSNIGEDFEDDIVEEEIKEILKRNSTPEQEREVSPYDDMSEEEKQELMRAEELKLKKQKAMQETSASNLRPIVLPGSRRWSEPEDAIPIFKKPKMSEEQMFETIDNNLEVISGKRKGINFKKFEPPPKNLGYLQNSEVYRMIHGMDNPVRGIVSRPEKIAAVQDYYEASKGSP